MSDVNVLVWHWNEVATIVFVWAAVAAVAGSVAWKWRGRRALLWSLAVTVLGPPALLFGALGLMLLAKG
jgi:CHASE2 domain-containing sensor protein